jgi:cytochrome c
MPRPAAILLLCALPMLAACSGADNQAIARGGAVFETCSACHSITGQTVLGPPLNGVVGRKVGSVPGFQYSDAFKNGGFVWTSEKLATFLQNPDSVPGSNMVITPLNEADARDVVAFLESKG